MIDPGLFINGPRVVKALRQITEAPLRYIIYTHGHFDHAFGTPALLDEARRRGDQDPEIVGHLNIARRFERYAKTAGHLAVTYDMQFASWGAGGGDVVRNARYVPPTLSYEQSLALDLGDITLDCRHGLGETDDHSWIWVVEPRVIVGEATSSCPQFPTRELLSESSVTYSSGRKCSRRWPRESRPRW